MSTTAPSPIDEAPTAEYDAESVASAALSKIASSASVSSIPTLPEYDIKSSISIAEIKGKLSELLRAKGPHLIQLRMKQGEKINYQDFFYQLSGKKIPRVNKSLQKIPDNLSIDEVELIIKEKIKSNLMDVIRSFWLFDMNKDGLIQKTELRRIIRNYCFDLSDDLFDDLWKSYDPKSTGIISYRDFLVKLGISADRYKKYMPPATAASSLCWKESKKKDGAFDNKSCEQKCKRAALENRDDPAIQGLPLEEIIVIFIDRLRRRYKLLQSTFGLFDSENKGQIPLSDFRGVINFFVLAMSSSLFSRVMKKLHIDVTAEGLDYHAFLENFCKSDKQESSAKGSENLDIVCAPVVQRIKNRVLNPEARLRSVFTKISADHEWQITRPELKKAVELGLDFKLSDDEFKDLTTILDPGNTNIINCIDFIHLFEDYCDTDCIRKQNSLLPEKVIDVEKYRNMSGKKLITRLKHHFNKNISNIEKAILVCDPDQSGFILPEKLKDILSAFCFPLTEDQFQEIITDVRKYGNCINYHEFITVFKKAPNESKFSLDEPTVVGKHWCIPLRSVTRFHSRYLLVKWFTMLIANCSHILWKAVQDTKKWIAIVDKLVNFKSKCSPEMPVSEVEELLKDCVKSRKTAILKDFKALDVCNVGIACKDDTRSILAKFAFRLTDKQFEALWETFPRNKYDQLFYDKFLEEYSSTEQFPDSKEKKPPGEDPDESKSGGKGTALKTGCKSPKEMRKDVTVKSIENRKTFKEIFYAKAPQLKHIFESMEPVIIRNFRTIRFHLRRADPKVTDMVDFVTLKSILAKSGIYFNKEDEFHILEYFDTRLTGKINYRDFLRIFVWYA